MHLLGGDEDARVRLCPVTCDGRGPVVPDDFSRAAGHCEAAARSMAHLCVAERDQTTRRGRLQLAGRHPGGAARGARHVRGLHSRRALQSWAGSLVRAMHVRRRVLSSHAGHARPHRSWCRSGRSLHFAPDDPMGGYATRASVLLQPPCRSPRRLHSSRPLATVDHTATFACAPTATIGAGDCEPTAIAAFTFPAASGSTAQPPSIPLPCIHRRCSSGHWRRRAHRPSRFGLPLQPCGMEH